MPVWPIVQNGTKLDEFSAILTENSQRQIMRSEDERPERSKRAWALRRGTHSPWKDPARVRKMLQVALWNDLGNAELIHPHEGLAT